MVSGFESLPPSQTSLTLRVSFVWAGKRGVSPSPAQPANIQTREVCPAEAAEPRRRTTAQRDPSENFERS